jgi:hypothetical protein
MLLNSDDAPRACVATAAIKPQARAGLRTASGNGVEAPLGGHREKTRGFYV